MTCCALDARFTLSPAASTCSIVRSSHRSAQANSSARMARPAATISKPGPGSGIIARPASTTTKPASATAARTMRLRWR